MSEQSFTPESIIEIKSLYPDRSIIKLDCEKARAPKTGNAKVLYMTTTLLNREGEYVKWPKMKFSNVVCTGSAKFFEKADGTNPKNTAVSFGGLDAKKLADTTYKATGHKALITAHTNFCEALRIIAEDYEKFVQEEIIDGGSASFQPALPKIHTIRQVTRKLNDDEKKTAKRGVFTAPLPHPIYRVRIPVVDDGRIGKKKWDTKTFSDVVYNKAKFDIAFKEARIKAEMNAVKKGVKFDPMAVKVGRIPACFESNGEIEALDYKNAGKFVTAFSLLTGIIEFKDACSSAQGISFPIEFSELHVRRHKPMERAKMTDADLMANDGEIEFEDDGDDGTVALEEPEEDGERKITKKSVAKSAKSENKVSKSKKSVPVSDNENENENENENDDEEPEDNDTEEPEEEIEEEPEPVPEPVKKVAKPTAKKTVAPAKKPAAKKPAPAPAPEPEPEVEEPEVEEPEPEIDAEIEDVEVEIEPEPEPEPVKKPAKKSAAPKKKTAAKKSV